MQYEDEDRQAGLIGNLVPFVVNSATGTSGGMTKFNLFSFRMYLLLNTSVRMKQFDFGARRERKLKTCRPEDNEPLHCTILNLNRFISRHYVIIICSVKVFSISI